MIKNTANICIKYIFLLVHRECTKEQKQSNNMKTTLLILLAMCSTVSASTVITTQYANKYLSFGGGSVLHDGPVVQTGITTTFENGAFIGIWTSYSPDGESNLGDEVDFSTGWSGAIGKGWTLGYSLIYFDEQKLSDLGAGDILYNKLVLSRQVSDYTLAFTVRNYSPIRGSGFEGGWLIGASVSRNFQLSEKLSLFTSVELNHDTGTFGLDSGMMVNPFVGLSYSINDAITWDIIQASGHIQLTTDDARKSDIMWSTGFKYSF